MYENNVNYSDYSSKDMYTVFLQDIVKKLSPYEWRAFEIIVASGVSEEKDAKEAVIQALIDNGEPCKSEDTAWRAIKALVKTNADSSSGANIKVNAGKALSANASSGGTVGYKSEHDVDIHIKKSSGGSVHKL